MRRRRCESATSAGAPANGACECSAVVQAGELQLKVLPYIVPNILPYSLAPGHRLQATPGARASFCVALVVSKWVDGQTEQCTCVCVCVCAGGDDPLISAS